MLPVRARAVWRSARRIGGQHSAVWPLPKRQGVLCTRASSIAPAATPTPSRSPARSRQRRVQLSHQTCSSRCSRPPEIKAGHSRPCRHILPLPKRIHRARAMQPRQSNYCAWTGWHYPLGLSERHPSELYSPAKKRLAAERLFGTGMLSRGHTRLSCVPLS